MCGEQVCFRLVNNMKSWRAWTSLNYTLRKTTLKEGEGGSWISVRSNPPVCYFSNKWGSDIGCVLKHASWLKWAVIITLRGFATQRWPNCLRQLTCNSLKGWCIISLRTNVDCSCTGSKNEAFHSDASSGLILFQDASGTHWNCKLQISDEPGGERARMGTWEHLEFWIRVEISNLIFPARFWYPHTVIFALSVFYWKFT